MKDQSLLPEEAQRAAWRTVARQWVTSLDRFSEAAALRVGPGSLLDPEYRRKVLWEKFRLEAMFPKYRPRNAPAPVTPRDDMTPDVRLWWRKHMLDLKWIHPDISPFSVYRLKSDDFWYPYAEELARGDKPQPAVASSPSRSSAGARGWDRAVRGWGAAVLLFALILLLVRLSNRCLRRPLFKAKRRRSAESSTSNVQATCSVNGVPDEELGSLDPYSETVLEVNSTDLAPPPYSHVEPASKPHDEPPPPYSDCFVALSNPKDDAPTNRRDDITEGAREEELLERIPDTGQDARETSSNSDESISDDGSQRVMMEFDDDDSMMSNVVDMIGDDVKEESASIGDEFSNIADDDVKLRIVFDSVDNNVAIDI